MGREMGYKFKSSFYRKIILSGKLNVKMTPPWVLRVFRRARCHRYKYLFFNGKYSSPLAHFSKAKNKSMFAITRPSLLKSTAPKLFLRESAKNDRRPFWKLPCFFRYSRVLYLSPKKSEICGIYLPYNVIQMV